MNVPISMVNLDAIIHQCTLSTSIERMQSAFLSEIREWISWSPQDEHEISSLLFSSLGDSLQILSTFPLSAPVTPVLLRKIMQEYLLPQWQQVYRSIFNRGISLISSHTLFSIFREVFFQDLLNKGLLSTQTMHLLYLVFDWLNEQAVAFWEIQPPQARELLSYGAVEIDQLRPIVQSVRSPIDLQPVFQLIVDRVKNSGIWEMCAIGLIDDEDKVIMAPAQAGFIENYPKDIKFPATGSATLAAIRRQKPIAISDVAEDTEFPVLQEAAKAGGYRAILLVPILVENIKGVVNFCSAQPHNYSSDEILLANAIAQQVTIAIENAFHYGQEKQRVEELESMNRVIARLNRMLQQSAETHTALTRLVLNNVGLDGIIKAIRKVLGNPVTVENENFQLIGFSEDWDTFDSHRIESIKAGGTTRDVIEGEGTHNILSTLHTNRRAVLIPTLTSLGIEKRRIVAPIIVGGDVIGYVWVMEALNSFDEQDLITAEQAALVLALEMVKQRAAFETELRLKADFIDDLLSKRSGKETDLLQRAAYLGYSFTNPSILLILECPNSGETGDNMVMAQGRNRQVVLRVQETVSQFTVENIVALQSSSILLILPVLEDKDNPKSLVSKLCAAVRRELARIDVNIKVLIGVSEPCYSLEEVRAAYLQVRRTIEAAKYLGRLDENVRMSDLGIYGILFREGDQGELEAFAENRLLPLIQYDGSHGSNLLDTLEAYLTHQSRLMETSRHLYIHVNTLRQRLERIEEIMGVTLDNPLLRLDLQVALRIYYMTNPKSR